MNIYEKILAQIERRNKPVHIYNVRVKVLSEKAEEAKVGNVLNDWSYSFYYNDPAETEEQRVQTVLQSARETFSRLYYGDIRGRTPAMQSREQLNYMLDYEFEITKVFG